MASTGTAELTITYRAAGGPLSIATVANEELLRRAAQIALLEAEEFAESVAEDDPILGLLQAEETRHLKATLELLIPGFAHGESLMPCVQ